MTPSEFAAKWMGVETTERAAAQSHFIDLCGLLGVGAPLDLDPTGEWYAFEKGAEKLGGGDGFADVWKRGHFAWEYKGKRRYLAAAYRQLNEYREALENPPLLVVCDLDRFEVHTNFTGTVAETHAFALADLADSPGGAAPGPARRHARPRGPAAAADAPGADRGGRGPVRAPRRRAARSWPRAADRGPLP